VQQEDGTFLLLLKEKGMRGGEPWALRWTDVDLEHCIVSCNNPEKGGIARQSKISTKLASMLGALPKDNERLWNGSLQHFRINYGYQRRRLAVKLQNPRLKMVNLHSLRHFYVSMLYAKQHDIILVQQRLGHRSIASTMVYTHLVNFEEDDYIVCRPRTSREEDGLIKAGLEYVRYDAKEEAPTYRKRK
jgi:integrase